MNRHLARPALVVAALSFGALGVTACGSSSNAAGTTASKPSTTSTSSTTTTASAPAASAKIATTLTEYKIATTPSVATAGRVTFTVKNAGAIKHQFTIIRTDKPAATVLSKQNPDDDIPGARGEISSLAPGATKTLVIKNLKPGHYALVCALPGHYQSGMHADFTVQ